jgi:hypothetical protein
MLSEAGGRNNTVTITSPFSVFTAKGDFFVNNLDFYSLCIY